ncbi:MAG: hypothetical protein FWD27_09735, partial [Coriobacteriia bacterium]|nr:hypothetical protein [Coriobacteriia bacterium]
MMTKLTKTMALLTLLLLLFGCTHQNNGHDDNSSSLSAAGSVAEINIVLPGSVEEIAALSSSKDGKTV